MRFLEQQVVWVDLGEPPTQVIGHEQGRRRPCIIVKTFPSLGLAWIIPCTSSSSLTYFSVVHLERGVGGLNQESYALCHQLRTVSYDRIDGQIGILDDINFDKIKAVIFDILDN